MENPNLPEELLIEIFSRLPAKSVGRCRCLSKTWCRKLSTSQFVNFHLNRRPYQTDAILVTRSYSLRTIRIPVDGTDKVVSRELDLPTNTFDRAVGSCNGLVLVLGRNREFFVVNPLTLQQVRVENTPSSYLSNTNSTPPSYGRYSYGFGFDKCNDDYKIVKLSHYYNMECKPTETVIDIYSLKNHVWKSVSSPYGHLDCEEKDGVFMYGAIHWLVLDKDDRYVIAAFDVATELFRSIPAPNDKLVQSLSYTVFGIAGYLLLQLDPVGMLRRRGTLDMWIMKEYGRVNSWTKFSIMISVNDDGFIKPMCFIKENEVVFLTTKETLLVWNLIEGTKRNIIADGALQKTFIGQMFVASLVSPVQSDIAS